MNGLPVTFLCYWGGKISNPSNGCEYDIPPKYPLKVNSRWSYDKLQTELYQATGLNKREFKLGVTCRYPICFGNTISYIAFPINDDITVGAMFDVLTYYSGRTLQLYLEIESIENQYIGDTVVSHMDKDNLNSSPYNHDLGNGTPSTFQSDVGTSRQIENSVVHTDISPPVHRNERGLNDDLENDFEDEENYENMIMEGDDESSSSSNDIEETAIGGETLMSESDQLRKGLLFKSKTDMQCAVKKYHIQKNWRYKVQKNTDETWVICCYKKEYPCIFYLRASLLPKKHGLWEVIFVRGTHTCLCAGQDYFHLDSKLIAWDILGLIKKDPELKIRIIVESVKKNFNKEISYKKAWCGKQKAIAHIYGDWDKSYQRLPKVLASIKHYNPGTIVEYYKSPPPGQMGIFRRVFWAFGPCIQAFTYCRPVVSIDGTFLYGKYKGVLLIAMGYDAYDSILPLAFAVVKNKSFNTWNWFLNLVQEHVVKGRDICLISDHHQGILRAIRVNKWTNITHRFCLRYVRANFCKVHTSDHLKRLVWKAGCSHQGRKFEGVLEQIELISKDVVTWLRTIRKSLWTLAHDGGYRYGIMTTNLSKLLNGVLKGSRGMPITCIIENTFFRCVFYFQSRRDIVELALKNIGLPNNQPQNRFSPKVNQMLLHNTEKARGMHVTIFNNSGRRDSGAYSVTKGGNTQTVCFDKRTCTCGKWEIYHVPCSHVLACCNHQNIDPSTFVSSYYNIKKYQLTWGGRFEPLEAEAYWNEYNGPVFTPNPNLEW